MRSARALCNSGMPAMIKNPAIATMARPKHVLLSVPFLARTITRSTVAPNDSHTARVIVATIASGTEPRSSPAFKPLTVPRRSECQARRPSRLSETPLATACNSGPRARSAW